MIYPKCFISVLFFDYKLFLETIGTGHTLLQVLAVAGETDGEGIVLGLIDGMGKPLDADGHVVDTGLEGDQPPAECPVCHVGADKFKKMEGDMTLAAEHEYGVYGKTVKNNPDIKEEDKKFIFDQLMANFQGECSEVGMYLCMARIAHREGYPEIGLYWEKAAYEEAEHAAKFAELLGEDLEPNMKATTKDNLAWRVDCEFGATAGKFDLAKVAKMNNLDAIHDTVHEMARDEARHGKALKGLLERYFG